MLGPYQRTWRGVAWRGTESLAVAAAAVAIASGPLSQRVVVVQQRAVHGVLLVVLVVLLVGVRVVRVVHPHDAGLAAGLHAAVGTHPELGGGVGRRARHHVGL